MGKYDRLNNEQQEAVFHVDGPLLILAGAGSGKTSVITSRIAYLIDEVGVNPYNILAITFTNKAADEMRSRVDKMVGFGSEQIFVSTFHSMCVRILRRHIDGLNQGYDSNFTIYDSDDQKSIVKEALKKLNIDTKTLKERTVMNCISAAKDELMTPEEYAREAGHDFNNRQIAKVYTEYQATLRKNNALDFDDLLMKTVELFEKCPEVLKTYHNRWQYIMVDEYQDTNTAQFELIKLLASAHRNLCVVGDDDQSIYKFRGANIRNILDFEKTYTDAKVIKLEQNYRSVQNVLDAANAVIRNNASRKDKKLWSKKEAGEPIHFRQFDTAAEEADYIASDIAKAARTGRADFGESAVLYRTNAQSRLIEERMVKGNIPYKIVGGVNFYSRREIKDLLAYLKTIDNGKDDLACKRIINVPKRGIGATTITKLQTAADDRELSFFDMLSNAAYAGISGSAADKLHNFESMILRLRAFAQEMLPSKVLKEVLDITDYINQMDVEDEEEAQERIANIEEFISKAVGYEEEHSDATLSGFLEEVALVADIDSVQEGDQVCLLMTIHSAKGLEFKNVYLAGMEDGLFPGYMSITSGSEEIEEERRLAYVAITRAKEFLTICAARARMINGETQFNTVSRFVHEIPRTLFDTPPMKNRSGGRYSDDEDDEGFGGFSGFKRRSTYDDGDDGFSGFSRTSDRSSDDGYSGFKREREPQTETSPYAGGYSRPRAFYTPKKTPEVEKPFIARTNLSTLTKGSDFSGSSCDIKPGDRVKHIKFGTGTVISVVQEPKDKKVTVQFDTAGQKIMYAAFAKLEKI